jgi:RecA-family ATPase
MKPSSLNDLLNSDLSSHLEFTLKGLLKGHVGMLIAAPNVGKSHLALCLAMEHSSSSTLLGLSTSPIPKKTLVISAEDGIGILKERMQEKLANLSPLMRSELNENLSFMTDIEPIVVPPDSSMELKKANESYINELIKILSNYDLAILDTVTEAIGTCEEVKHDRLIKNTVQRMAKESGCSLLLVHHVNKDEIRGAQEITMASGAGLTSVMRLTKCLFTLQHKKERLFIKFLKSNYLSYDDSHEIDLKIVNSLTINSEVFNLKNIVAQKRSRVTDGIKNEPRTITISGEPKSDKEIKERKSLRDVL